MSRARVAVVLVAVFVWAGCVQVPLLETETTDAGSLGLAALGHRVDAAVAPWEPLVPGCGAASGAGGDGVGGDADAFDGADGLDAGTDFAPRPPGSTPGERLPPGLPGPAGAGAVLITEIMANPAALSDTQGEWFELFNPGAGALDLAGCVIGDGGDGARAIRGAFVLEPGQYRVVARSAAPGFAPDLVAVFSLSNDADTLSLQCAGQVIDAVAYATNQGFALKAGVSLSLDPSQLDALHNDLGPSWCAAVDAYSSDLGTPGAANPACAAPG